MCIALVLSDAIWHDPGTGKRTILGVFSTIFAREFPAIHPLLALYCVLSDGRGKTEINVKLVDVDGEHDPLVDAKSTVEFNDPRTIVELDMHFTGISFAHPGEYRFQVFAGDEFLLERRLLVLDVNDIQKPPTE
jgi:hypothetical protein